MRVWRQGEEFLNCVRGVINGFRENCLKKLAGEDFVSRSREREIYFSLAEQYRHAPSVVSSVNKHEIELDEAMTKFFYFSHSKRCFFLGTYHARNSEEGSSCGFSKMIIQLKRNNSNAIKSFVDFFAPLRLCETVIVAVPSSKPDAMSGIRILAKEIAKMIGCRVLSGLLKRTREIPKKSLGGERDEELELDSLKLNDADRFKGKNILLMDGVITTGGTMSACEEIIYRNSEPKNIVRFALGKTYSDYWNDRVSSPFDSNEISQWEDTPF